MALEGGIVLMLWQRRARCVRFQAIQTTLCQETVRNLCDAAMAIFRSQPMLLELDELSSVRLLQR